MKRLALLLGTILAFSAFDESPPISITSPDEGGTYVYAVVKQHSLVWDKHRKELYAHLVFTDIDPTGPANDDSHDFRLPGVTLDPATGIFSATSPKGKVIPVAKMKKQLFFNTIETLPNSVVRIVRLHGSVSVVLEAIEPDSPAMKPPPPSPADDNPDHTHAVDLHDILH